MRVGGVVGHLVAFFFVSGRTGAERRRVFEEIRTAHNALSNKRRILAGDGYKDIGKKRVEV